MWNRLSKSPKALVALQFIPVFLLPPSLFDQLVPLAVVQLIFLVAVILGLMRRRPWSQTLSVFVMGFNFITKLMLFFPHIVSPAGEVNYVFGAIMLTSIVFSAILLYLMDQPVITIRITR